MKIIPFKNFFNFKYKTVITSLMTLSLLILPAISQAAPRMRHSQRMSGLLTLAVLVLMLKFGVLAFSLLLTVLRPHLVIENSRILNKHVIKSCFIGALACVFYILLLKILRYIPSPVNRPLYLIIFTVIMAHFILGFSSVCHSIGEKIQANTNSTLIGSAFAAVLFGGIVLLLLDFLPLLGQIVSAIIFLASLGIVFSSSKNKTAKEPPT